jgi:hypothetical protein
MRDWAEGGGGEVEEAVDFVSGVGGFLDAVLDEERV